MGVQVATRQTAPPQRADPQRTATHQTLGAAGSAPSPIHHLQRAIGNRALSSLLRSPIVQPKLTISQPGDAYELEADRVADQVMRMPDNQTVGTLKISNPGMVQRKCDCGGGAGDCAECKEKEANQPPG